MRFVPCVIFVFAALPCSFPQAADKEGLGEAVRRLQQEYMDAFAKGIKASVSYMERVLAEDATFTEDSGRTYTKAKLLEMAKTALKEGGGRGPVKIEQKELVIRVYGETAIATGLFLIKGPVEESNRFVHVYVERNGRLQIVAAQYTNVRRP